MELTKAQEQEIKKLPCFSIDEFPVMNDDQRLNYIDTYINYLRLAIKEIPVAVCNNNPNKDVANKIQIAINKIDEVINIVESLDDLPLIVKVRKENLLNFKKHVNDYKLGLNKLGKNDYVIYKLIAHCRLIFKTLPDFAETFESKHLKKVLVILTGGEGVASMDSQSPEIKAAEKAIKRFRDKNSKFVT